MRNFYKVFPIYFLILLFGCSKEDDNTEEVGDKFYVNALASANEELLTGTWAIFEAGYNGNSAEIPVNYEECGRDFFHFIENGTYKDYIITSSYECQKQILDLNWEMYEGVVTLSNSLQQSYEMVILELTPDKLVFKLKFDIDEDGELDIITFAARRYAPPNDQDLYSYTFHPSQIETSQDKIKLKWQTYNGFYGFDRYEIYRSTNGCSKINAELIASIENSSTDFFIDDNPPVEEEICYYFKLYNEKGLLSESELINFPTEYLIPAEVGFSDIKVLDGGIELNWQPYEGNYFSHYEITVRNYEGGTGAGYLEETVVQIEDKETVRFLDENPPYLLNPIYAIYAYDIFGNVSTMSSHDQNTWTVNWERPEILKFDFIQFAAIDHDGPEIYFFTEEKTMAQITI